MDIAYLMALQGLRERLGPGMETLFNLITKIGHGPVLLGIVLVIYWCFDRRIGLTVVCGFVFGQLTNQLIKNTVCCYRPWIRDARIHPSEPALDDATGYSFPSGHTLTAGTTAGGLGWAYRHRRPVMAAAALTIALVGFSRNYLGVHTPQDVAFALVESGIAIAAANAWAAWARDDNAKDSAFLASALVLAAAFLAYITLKPYPIDRNAVGKVLVDPVEMQVDCYEAAGAFAGFALAWWAERRWVRFSTPAGLPSRERVARGLIGAGAVAGAYGMAKLLDPLLGLRWAAFAQGLALIVSALLIAPALFRVIPHRTGDDVGSTTGPRASARTS